jgi:hypothetical protein
VRRDASPALGALQVRLGAAFNHRHHEHSHWLPFRVGEDEMVTFDLDGLNDHRLHDHLWELEPD